MEIPKGSVLHLFVGLVLVTAWQLGLGIQSIARPPAHLGSSAKSVLMIPQAGDSQLLDSLGLEGLLFHFCLLQGGVQFYSRRKNFPMRKVRHWNHLPGEGAVDFN